MAEGYQQRPSAASRAATLTAAVVAAATFIAPQTALFEGFAPRPYWDPAHIRTYCFGETENVEERTYERSECAQLLRRRLARDYGPRIAACIPGLVEPRRKPALGAAIDSSYNAGPLAVRKSRWAALMRDGRYAEGCEAIKGWYVTARDRRTGKRRVLPGLVKRRIAMSRICLAGA